MLLERCTRSQEKMPVEISLFASSKPVDGEQHSSRATGFGQASANTLSLHTLRGFELRNMTENVDML